MSQYPSRYNTYYLERAGVSLTSKKRWLLGFRKKERAPRAGLLLSLASGQEGGHLITQLVESAFYDTANTHQDDSLRDKFWQYWFANSFKCYNSHEVILERTVQSIHARLEGSYATGESTLSQTKGDYSFRGKQPGESKRRNAGPLQNNFGGEKKKAFKNSERSTMR
jgi:hypothetical protein